MIAFAGYQSVKETMPSVSEPDLPERPRLRAVDPRWVEQRGQRFLHLRDPISASDQGILLPNPIVPLVLLMNGDRTITEMGEAFTLRSGHSLTDKQLRGIIAQLDQFLLIENGAYAEAHQLALDSYRAATYRVPSHAGLVYPEQPTELSRTLDGYCDSIGPSDERSVAGSLVGMVCPHIDYARGHNTYASLWQAVAPNLSSVELVIILGTDHVGGRGQITLTRQPYATPYGVIPTDTLIIDRLAEEIGPERAFAQEINHVNEHSIELASVWLHHFTRDQTAPMVPILCGPLDPPEEIEGVVQALKSEVSRRPTLVIAAGDLAHVGPAFGDPVPLDATARADLTAADQRSIDAILASDASSFGASSWEEDDVRRLCGLPPIYLMLRLVQGAHGQSYAYDQCPADDQNGSVVSIVGALLYR
ncbi:AmmeMemoRadiSam system protein B [Dehalococcoidia bacterium]|nr:AmmeMemoRadiSam system protein B [Dehalococcoidia bacterium]